MPLGDLQVTGDAQHANHQEREALEDKEVMESSCLLHKEASPLHESSMSPKHFACWVLVFSIMFRLKKAAISLTARMGSKTNS